MIKKVFGLMMTAIMVFALAACGKTTEKGNENSAHSESDVKNEISAEQSSDSSESKTSVSAKKVTDGKTLVVYYSWSGNTGEMASHIAEQTGGDLYEIEPKTPYPEDYDEVADVAEVERDENARPEIGNLPESIGEYDTILVGYPIWWHTAPMIIGTFLENYDLTGVDVYPFTQSASMDTEQFENSIEFVREAAGGANVHDGLFAESSDIDAIDTYLNENGLVK